MQFLNKIREAEAGIISQLKTNGYDTGTVDELQRTADWFESRRGRFTGSGNKNLMNCTPSTGRMEWGKHEKLIDLGTTAKKYIYEKARERETGIVCELGDNKNFKYGRKCEPVISDMLIEMYPDFKIEPKGFIEVKGMEGILGASPDDAMVCTFQSEKITIGVEIKSAMNWGTHYDRVECKVDQSQKDFWQLQTEMLALSVDKILYVTSRPPKNIYDVINSDDPDEIRALIGGIDVIGVTASKIHQNALKQRCLIGDLIIKKYLSGIKFNEACQIVCSEFEASNER